MNANHTGVATSRALACGHALNSVAAAGTEIPNRTVRDTADGACENQADRKKRRNNAVPLGGPQSRKARKVTVDASATSLLFRPISPIPAAFCDDTAKSNEYFDQ
jgi:hypothetical protein